MGQRVRYLHIAAGPGARAWDLADDLDPRGVDMPRYRELLLRAVHEVMQPLGVSEDVLRAWLFSRAGYIAPPGLIRSSEDLDQDPPAAVRFQHERGPARHTMSPGRGTDQAPHSSTMR